MPIDHAPTSSSPAEGVQTPLPATPLAIQVEDLHKSFRIPTHRVDSLKERFVRPFAPQDYRELHALDGISFEIHRGEFFGIVGRNGSGKSTLLKLLASIYRADAGTIRMAGRLAPFIELGVGFNVELTARENVVLNGVMMGLTPKETHDRLDAVLEFAELTEFTDLKLKNYSSGMLVRLAFSVMLQADADILLIDEVLAVGDAAFQQKCDDAFRKMKAAGKTIVLVTHDMATVEEYCHRAMLISDGCIQHIGDPAEVGRRYLQLNFEEGSEVDAHVEAEIGEADEVRVVEARIENRTGEAVTSVEHGEEIHIHVEIEAKEDLDGLDVGFIVANADGVIVAQYSAAAGTPEARAIKTGQRLKVDSRLANPLAAGRYIVHCGINRAFVGSVALYVQNLLDFVVYGGPREGAVVSIPQTTEAVIEDGPER